MENVTVTDHSFDFSAARAAMRRCVDAKILAGVSCAVLAGRDLVDVNCVGCSATNFEFDFFHHRLVHASASIPSHAFDRLLAELSAKYGPPDRREGSLTNTIVYWTRGNSTSRVSKHAGSADLSAYSLTGNDYLREVGQRRAAQAREIATGH